MENQHRMISGYRELSQQEIDLINEIKQKGKELGDLIEKVDTHLCSDYKTGDGKVRDRMDAANSHTWKVRARDKFQDGIMFLIRAVAQPTDGM